MSMNIDNQLLSWEAFENKQPTETRTTEEGASHDKNE